MLQVYDEAEHDMSTLDGMWQARYKEVIVDHFLFDSLQWSQREIAGPTSCSAQRSARSKRIGLFSSRAFLSNESSECDRRTLRLVAYLYRIPEAIFIPGQGCGHFCVEME